MRVFKRGPIILLAHVLQNNNDDYEFLTKAAMSSGLKEDEYRILPRCLSASELKGVISKLGLLIAARTHATIAAFSSGIPTISISYSTKAIGLNEQMLGSTDYLIPAADLTPDRLVTVSRKALKNSKEIKERLRIVIPNVQQLVFDAGEKLKGTLLADYV
jgi:polysaccharide pyruvyl transferase WcaK-like protein